MPTYKPGWKTCGCVEIEGLIAAMDKLNLNEGSIIKFDQEDQFMKEGKTIQVIPGWKWLSGLIQE